MIDDLDDLYGALVAEFDDHLRDHIVSCRVVKGNYQNPNLQEKYIEIKSETDEYHITVIGNKLAIVRYQSSGFLIRTRFKSYDLNDPNIFGSFYKDLLQLLSEPIDDC